jgi:type IV secretion system protein VirD4
VILAPPMPERGIKAQVVLPRMQATQHGLILGGTGTGKSRGYFLPNCAQAVDTSLVVTDPKSELWKLTSGYREKAVRYAPADPDASACFNWIPLCNDARMAELCARAIVQSGNTSHTDQFFLDTESAFLAALFAHASTLPEATPLTAYGLFTKQPQEDLIRELLESPSEVARDQAIIFMQTDPRYKGAIVPAVSGRLQFMRDKAVRRFTSAALDAPDFGRLRQEPTAIYWCLREQDIVRLRPLTSLFFTVLLEQIAGVPEGSGGVPVTMFLDEFANIGTIPDFETTISLARGRGVALWLGVQSLSQLDKAYGHANAQTIITNCLTKIALHALDYNTAKYVSDTLGESTIVAKRHGFAFSPTGLISVSRHGTEHRKMLLTPDEVMRLSETEAIVRTGNKYPMKLKKGYYDEPANTAPTSALGEAISKEFPPLVLAGGPSASTGEGMNKTGNKQAEKTSDIL